MALRDDWLAAGREAIREFYAGLIAAGRKFELGEQRPAFVNGDLALTSTRLPNWRRDRRGRPQAGRRDLALGDRPAEDRVTEARLLACVGQIEGVLLPPKPVERRASFGVPSMIDSLEVQVLCPA